MFCSLTVIPVTLELSLYNVQRLRLVNVKKQSEHWSF